MVMSYEQAVAALYQGPLESFVAERKRLSGELKGSGDKDGSAKLGKLARPPISAWVVNQLYFRERDTFDELLESAALLRKGDLGATSAHREALATLRGQAAALLTESGHGASEATLRKVTTTLSALAASGGFDPDLPGALSADREPPGFEAFGFAAATSGPVEPTTPRTVKKRDAHADAERKAEEERRRKEEERRAAEEAREKKREERRRLEDEIRTAKAELEQRVRELMEAESNAKEARTALEKLKKRLEALD
jgi:DNA repair exonuclease SbcCD ATPase subunit